MGALLESVQAFQAPAAMRASRTSAVSMFSEGDIGVLPPLGVFDPLGLIETRDMRRYEIMEIKHGPPPCLASSMSSPSRPASASRATSPYRRTSSLLTSLLASSHLSRPSPPPDGSRSWC